MKRSSTIGIKLSLLALLIVPFLLFAQQATGQSTRMSYTPPIELSQDLYPTKTDTVVSSDGKVHPIAYRKPVGDGPFPVVLFFHGGVRSSSAENLSDMLNRATPTRFLKKGYMTVAATRRETKNLFAIENPKSFTGGLIYDSLASLEKTKALPGADPETIIIYGGSAGGSLAIETVAYSDVAALVLGEANPTLFPGLWLKHVKKSDESFGRAELYVDFEGYFTDEIRENVRYFFSQIECPILFLTGGNSGNPMPEMPIFMKAVEHKGEDAKNITYPSFTHGFYWGRAEVTPTGEQLDEIIEDVHDFVLPHLKTKPKPL